LSCSGVIRACPDNGTPHRRRRGIDDLQARTQPLEPSGLASRHDRAQVQPHQLDSASGPAGVEAEVAQEVRREDRAVADEPLGEAGVGAVPVGVRLERRKAAVAALPDRSENQALERPGAAGLDQVGARDDRGVAARRSGRHRVSAREGVRRAVLDEADHAAAVAVDLPPRSEVLFGVGDPTPLLAGVAAGTGLPPHALAARHGGVGDGRAGQMVDARGAHGAATSSTCTETTATSIATIDSR
jgi:hypothetical protein